MSTLNDQKQKIRLSLKAYNKDLLNIGCEKIKETLIRTQAKVKGPIYLPTRRRIYCVLRSPHVNKKAREHFEIRVHKRIFDIYELSAKTVDPFLQVEVPCGIAFDVQTNWN